MTVITDPIAALIRFLKLDADTIDMVGTRIFGAELPDAENTSMPRAAVVLRNSGGGLMPISSSYVPINDIRVDAYAYGATPNQAFRVYRCLAGALKQMHRNQQGRTVIYWARTSGGPSNLVEPNTEWPLTLSSWQVMYAEKEPA